MFPFNIYYATDFTFHMHEGKLVERLKKKTFRTCEGGWMCGGWIR